MAKKTPKKSKSSVFAIPKSDVVDPDLEPLQPNVGETQDADAASIGDTINNPALDPKTLKITRKAIKDAKQAWNVYTKLEQDNRDRNRQNADITEIYKGRQPFIQNEIESWQANFPTLFLAGIVDKVAPRIITYIEGAKSLTQSKLRDESADGTRKSEILRGIFTKYVRRWSGWRNFCSLLAQELTLIGYGFAARTDEYDWRPKFYRQDEAFIPDGTSQFSTDVQVLGIRQDFLIHELTDIILDKKAADTAGWTIDNCVAEINQATGRNETITSQSGADENDRRFVDAIREGNLGAGLAKGAKTVKVAHLLVIETGLDGKVSHWIVSRERENRELFMREARFNSMSDVVCLFTFEPGNGKFYSAKGIGRMLANYAVAMDVVTNEAVNQARIAGLIPVLVDHSKGAPPCKIRPPFLEINSEMKEFDNGQNLAANLAATVQLIDHLQKMAEVATQQYIPGVAGLNEEPNATATEKRIDYTRELQSQASFLGRFAGQFAEMIGMMQRSMFDPDTNDEEAKLAREEALGNKKKQVPAIVTEAELKEWAESPAAEVLQDLSEADNQATIAAANDPEVVQSNLIDQKVRLRAKLEAMLPVPVADSWFLPDALDPNDAAEQMRQQMIETEAILSGSQGMPVSGRDNHKIHLDTLMPDLAASEQGFLTNFQQNPLQVVNDPNIGMKLDHVNAGIRHGDAHVLKWKQAGAPPEVTQPYENALDQGTQRFQRFIQNIDNLKQRQSQMAATLAKAGMPPSPGMNGAAPQPGANGANGAAQPPQVPAPPDQGLPGAPLPFTEKVATSWIAQYEYLDEPEQERLEILTGLGVAKAPPPAPGAPAAAAPPQTGSPVTPSTPTAGTPAPSGMPAPGQDAVQAAAAAAQAQAQQQQSGAQDNSGSPSATVSPGPNLAPVPQQ